MWILRPDAEYTKVIVFVADNRSSGKIHGEKQTSIHVCFVRQINDGPDRVRGVKEICFVRDRKSSDTKKKTGKSLLELVPASFK